MYPLVPWPLQVRCGVGQGAGFRTCLAVRLPEDPNQLLVYVPLLVLLRHKGSFSKAPGKIKAQVLGQWFVVMGQVLCSATQVHTQKPPGVRPEGFLHVQKWYNAYRDQRSSVRTCQVWWGIPWRFGGQQEFELLLAGECPARGQVGLRRAWRPVC